MAENELIGLFDTHAHPTDERFDEDRAEVLSRMRQAGMLCMCVGADMASSAQSVTLANENDNIYAAVGVHPHDAKRVTEADVPQLIRWLTQEKKVKALGEIGLDYHYEDIPREIQQRAFRAQMALAQELKLPVIVHEREAHEDGMKIVEEFQDVTGVFHCYSGSLEMAKMLIRRGWYIGFGGVLTFKNARKAVEVAAQIPLERIVLETDCPYMSPEPFRGKRNDPTRLYRMAEALASLWGVSPEEAQAITFENGKRLYGI